MKVELSANRKGKGFEGAVINSSFPVGAGNYRNAGGNVIIGCKKGTLLTVFNIIGE